METYDFSIIIPCFNEEKSIEDTTNAILHSLPEEAKYEIVAVDDGSTDDSGNILARLSSKHETITCIRHTSNQGYGAAIKTGVRRSKSELLAIIDADGTYPIERLYELVQTAREADMVVGARTGESVVHSRLRGIPKLFFKKYVSWITRAEVPDMNSGMRVIKRRVLQKFFNILPDTFSFTTTITMALLHHHYDVRFVPINYGKRVGKSKIRPLKDTLNFFQLILRTGMYFAPLRVLAPLIYILTFSFFLSLLVDIFLLRNLTDKTVILLVFALNTIMLGLIADMIDKRSAS